jgi:hypothetical protein
LADSSNGGNHPFRTGIFKNRHAAKNKDIVELESDLS